MPANPFMRFTLKLLINQYYPFVKIRYLWRKDVTGITSLKFINLMSMHNLVVVQTVSFIRV